MFSCDLVTKVWFFFALEADLRKTKVMDTIDEEKILKDLLVGKTLDVPVILDNAFYARFGMSVEDVADMLRTGDILF